MRYNVLFCDDDQLSERSKSRIEQVIEELQDSDALLADGFDAALIGLTQSPNVLAVYEYDMCLRILMSYRV